MAESLKPVPFEILPFNMEQKHRKFFENHSLINTNPAKHIKVKRAFVFWQGQVFKNGKIIPESLCTPLFLKRYSAKFFLKGLFKSILKMKLVFFKKSQYIIVHDEWSSNYFHWMTDVLTRLYISLNTLPEKKLILPEIFKSSYQAYTLEKFSITNIEWTNDKRILFVRELTIPLPATAPGGYYNPEILRNAVNFLIKGHSTNLNRGQKIYITRQKASGRKVINEKEVMHFLESHGFAIIFCEELSFEEQLSIFSHAKILISVHGAGLTNLMFMQPESSILELRKFDDSDKYNCFFRLASVFNHRYFYQVCEHLDTEKESLYDINVDMNILKNNLGLLIK